MPRWFNVSGPCNPENHYMLPATRRLPSVRRLVEQQAYFVLHAPRQVGKTTAMTALAKELTAEGRYTSALVSMEVGAVESHDPGAAELAILEDWRRILRWQLPAELQPPPWLVNALAKRVVEELVTDRGQAVAATHIDEAKEILIQRQDTHLDSLSERLREPRVRAIVEPMLGGGFPGDVPEDNRRYIIDLGLLRRDAAGGLVVANPLYKEMLVRALASGPRDALPSIQPSWLRPGGRIDFSKLLEAFLSFWRQHGEPLLRSAP